MKWTSMRMECSSVKRPVQIPGYATALRYVQLNEGVNPTRQPD